MFDARDMKERFRDTRKFRAFPTPVCLDYLEAKAFPDIAPERQYHAEVCLYCSTMVKTVIRSKTIEPAGLFAKTWAQLRKFFHIGPSA